MVKVIQTWYGTGDTKGDCAIQYVENISQELIDELLEETENNSHEDENWVLEIFDDDKLLRFTKSLFSKTNFND